jgi:hypothetical protein
MLLPVALVLAAAALVAGSPKPPSAVDPSDFVRHVDNAWFPLEPGTTYRHVGSKAGKRAVDVFRVSGQTKEILGVINTVVVDKLYVNGRLEEIAHDWYAQDRKGNVWYFGETIREFNSKGKEIPAQGAWQAGVDGARAGIVMPARPRVGYEFRPEYYKGTAEDRYRILDLSAKLKTPYVLGLKFHPRRWTPGPERA